MRIIISERQFLTVSKRILNEDNLLSKFYGENSFENCRGVRLFLRKNDESPSVSLTNKEKRQLRKQTSKENKANYNNFLSSNSLTPEEISMDYFLDLKEEKETYDGMAGSYPEIYDENGKPFTKNTTQSNVNIIEKLASSGGSGKKVFFWKNYFGNKKPQIIDFYNYFKQNGGEEGLKKLQDSFYPLDSIYDILNKNIEEYNNELKKQWPFQKPKDNKNFALIYYDKDNFGRSLQKVRYFNNYEEFALAIEVAKNVDKNEVKMGSFNPGGFSGEATIVNKPKGDKTLELFK